MVAARDDACHHPIRSGCGPAPTGTAAPVIRFGGCPSHARHGGMSGIDPGRGQARPEDTATPIREAVMGFDHQDRDRAACRALATEVTR
jgi:hypothetical protein